MKKREIVLCIILSLVTCGIYSLVWLAFMANDLKELANEPDKMGGGMVVLLSIVTCGIYMFYWYYQAGKSVEKAKYMRNMSYDNSSGVIYMVLAFFGLGIVSMGLIQNEINNMVYVSPMNDGSGFDFNTQNNYSDSQPYDNQNYYNKGYDQNNYNNNQGYGQNNYNNYNNNNQGYDQNNYNNYNNNKQGYDQNNYNDPNNTNN